MAKKTRVKTHLKKAPSGAVVTVTTHDRMIPNLGMGMMERKPPSISMSMRDGKPECSAYGIENEEDAMHVAGLARTLQQELAAKKKSPADDEDDEA